MQASLALAQRHGHLTRHKYNSLRHLAVLTRSAPNSPVQAVIIVQLFVSYQNTITTSI